MAATKKALNFDELSDGEESIVEEEEDDLMCGSRPLFPDDILTKLTNDYDDILHIFHTCTEEDPEKRPSADKLEKIFEELNIIVID